MAQKEIGNRILGSPGTPWNLQNHEKVTKNRFQKSMKFHTALKDPPRADLQVFAEASKVTKK